MAVNLPLDATTSDDQTAITWQDPLYPYPLNRFSVMHYFEFSPFFDRKSNNSIARRQNLDPAVPGVLESLPPGIEYIVEVDQAPNLFVIRKQVRSKAAGDPAQQSAGAQQTTLFLSQYYVLDKVIYQAPTLYAALATRLKRCVFSLEKGFQALKKDLDPLQRLIRDEERRQQEREADTSGPSSSDAATAAAALESKMRRSSPSAGHSSEEEVRWRKSMNIIDTVLHQYPLPKMPPEYYHQQPGSLSAPSEANIATRNDAGKVMSDTSVQQQQQQPGKSQPEAPTQSQVPVIAPGAISSEQPQAKRLRKN